MKVAICFIILCAVSTAYSGVPERDKVADLLRSVPLRFEPGSRPNQFLARGAKAEYLVEPARLTVKGTHAVKLRFQNAAPGARIEASDQLRSTTNLFLGNQREKWRTAVPNFKRVQVHGLYRGIDLTWYGTDGQLEYDLIVQPGADPAQIRLRFDGPQPKLDADGNLAGGFLQKRAITYQISNGGAQVPVDARYRQNADSTFSIVVGPYDHHRELTIDPVLTLSQYIGGAGQDVATAIGHDAQGFLYVGGTTGSSDFPLVGNSQQTTLTGISNVFVVKIDPNASRDSQIVYATYLGGTGADVLQAMVVTPRDFIYLTGSTTSVDFPLGNAAQSTLSGPSDAFVVVLDATQPGTSSVFYATYFGGSQDDVGNAIAVDAKGRPFIAGTTNSSDMVTGGGFQSGAIGSTDAFVAGFDSPQQGANTLYYSTYLGGSKSDVARSLAFVPDGSLWVAGITFSPDFPIAGASYQGSYQGGGDVFVAQISVGAGANGLLYSTFLGGTGQDEAKKLIVDAVGRVLLTGYTTSLDFPVTLTAFQPFYGGNTDAFVTILNPLGSANPLLAGSPKLIYSTYYGGSSAEVPYDMVADTAGNLYITGYTTSPDLPITNSALQSSYSNGFNAFVLKLNPSLPALQGLQYASYLAGPGNQAGNAIDLAPNSTIYVAGYATGPIFNSVGGARRVNDVGLADAFLLGFSSCAFNTSVHSYQFPHSGGTLNVNVLTTSDCSWSASSNLDWVSVSPSGGAGGGSVTITVTPNTTGAPRQDVITLAGIQFVVGQDQ